MYTMSIILLVSLHIVKDILIMMRAGKQDIHNVKVCGRCSCSSQSSSDSSTDDSYTGACSEIRGGGRNPIVFLGRDGGW